MVLNLGYTCNIKEKPPEGGSDYFLLVKKVSVPKR